jgi:RNA polymerase sigma-70 factor (ECF subfamily)
VQPDADRVRRILKGDPVEFRHLFDEFFPRLYRSAVARLDGDSEAATEVVQATFCKAIEKLDGYRGEAALYSWFHAICHNQLVDYCRRMNRDARVLTKLEDSAHARAVLDALAGPASEQPEVIADGRELRGIVQTVLDYMPERQACALEMKYVDSLPVAEIGQRLGIGTKAAESLLSRAREKFRDAMVELLDVQTRDQLRMAANGGQDHE